jgi:MOSC domain-containing protein YiiM
MEGKVIAVNISKTKGVVKQPIPEGNFIKDFGLEGDAHSGGGIRQVSLLGRESYNKYSDRVIKGLCDGKFAENITTEGIILYELPIGTLLQIGETIQQVSKIGKECHDGCEIKKLVGSCIMPKEGIFTIVIKGGIVKPGDIITIIQPDCLDKSN